ncbi:proline iminopeptidase-family hydrolase [Caulobacter endophyticus]|uniref:Proline iminopeptidase n=1 Tax=Caulobacter endophyticus TaxID=2172652 RepID=A0A2T9JFE4_9CAUL|nr:proline iminopeptidase-family hydrolase [Caulobacter endophyticus]PVM82379.1 proline iminopeptidase [Caulobacter endophyticus]
MRLIDRRRMLGLFAAAGATALASGAGRAVQAGPATFRPASFPEPDREVRLPVPGGRVYARVNGDLDAAVAGVGPPPIVMVHGGPGGTHSGFLDALALSDERAVILYDQLDSGLSDHPMNPANWTVGRFVDELEAVREGLKIPRWHVLGHSWGGTVALEYGARRSPALASLMLASPLVSTRSWIADANLLRGDLPPAVQDQLIRCEASAPSPSDKALSAACDAATNAFYAAFLTREPPSPAHRAYRPAGDRGFNPVLYKTMWGATEFSATGTLKAYDGEPLLDRLDGPRTLFMVGQYDESRPATAIGFSRRARGSELAVVPGAGHATFTDRPEETVAVLRQWLRRQDRRA